MFLTLQVVLEVVETLELLMTDSAAEVGPNSLHCIKTLPGNRRTKLGVINRLWIVKNWPNYYMQMKYLLPQAFIMTRIFFFEVNAEKRKWFLCSDTIIIG